MSHHIRLESDRPLEDRLILVVEDDYYLATDTARAITRAAGRVVGPFANEADAISALENNEISAAVIDINLGFGPSFALAHRLVERGIPLMFVTGYDWDAIPSDLASALRIEKPAPTSKIVSCVVALLRKAGTQDRPGFPVTLPTE